MLRQAALSLGLLLFVTRSAHADSAPPTGKRAVEASREAFEKGTQQYKANDLEGARISWAQSYAAFASISTLQNLAAVEYETDHCVDALKHFRIYLRSPNAEPAFLEKIPKLAADCNAKTGHVRVMVPSGVAVSVDGKRAVDLADVVDVLPGSHVVTAEGGGLHDTRPIAVGAGQTIELRFEPLAPAVDAGPRSAAPASPPDAAPSGPSATQTFWTAPHTWGVVLGSSAVVALGVGIGFGLAANSEKSSIVSMQGSQQHWACAGSASTGCSTLQDEKSTQRRNGILSDVGLGLGASLAVAAGIVWFLPADREKTGLWIAPSIGHAGGGVLAGTRF